MNTKHTQLDRIRMGLAIASAVTVTGGFALGSIQPASATPPIVPTGCGSYSGLPLPAGWTLDDNSGNSSGLGTAAAPYNVAATANMITVGTDFDDYINGNDVNEVICGLKGEDTIEGRGGDDEIFGDFGADTLSGQFSSDTLVGGNGKDVLYGDDSTNSSGNLDFGDVLEGQQKNDILLGGDGSDTLKGGKGSADFGDVQAGGGTCTGVEDGPTTGLC